MADAIFQLEIDRKRYPKRDGRSMPYYAGELVEFAMRDTFHNGGTFVLVVEPDKITAVQRRSAEPLEGEGVK